MHPSRQKRLTNTSEVLVAVYLIFQSRFSQLVGRMCDDCFGAQLPTFRTVMDYEDQLRSFDCDIPNSLRYQPTQVAAVRPYLSFQVTFSFLRVREASLTNRAAPVPEPRDQFHSGDSAGTLRSWHSGDLLTSPHLT